MPNELENTLFTYLNAVLSKLQNRNQQSVETGSLRLFPNKTRELQSLIDELESEPGFRRIVDETRASFLKIYRSSLMFRMSDLRDPIRLSIKLRDVGSPLSQYLRGQFSFDTKRLLDEHSGTDSSSELHRRLQKALTDEFNRVIQSALFYDERRFAEVKLTEQTQRLANQNPQGDDVILLNMLLLEEAYPLEIMQNPKREWWLQSVQNFFRRSGYYIDVFEGKTPSNEDVFQNYRKAFENQEVSVFYLAPIEFVEFNEKCMDFRRFQIRQFSLDELKVILSSRANEVFYPSDWVDVERLEGYWFVCLTESTPVSKRDWWDGIGWIHLPPPFQVKMEYTKYPPALEAAFQQLALYDWQADSFKNSPEWGWSGFSIPFVLKIHDNLLSSPFRAPDTSKLEKQSIFDPQTGEIEADSPMVLIRLSESEAELFKTFMYRMGKLFNSLKVQGERWQFLDVAQGYFIKAFFAEGLEQLLWHITVMEALLGEKGDGVTERLARRIASILGKSENTKKELKKQFREIYDFRSDFVHGNIFKKEVLNRHLCVARSIARRVLLWFLNYLGSICSETRQNWVPENMPTREEILILLDLDKNRRQCLSLIMGLVPEGFPYVREWVE